MCLLRIKSTKFLIQVSITTANQFGYFLIFEMTMAFEPISILGPNQYEF